ncbi:unnamed protein product [Absidia cylindrospora]
MSFKSISCTECRKHHRKCIRTDDTEDCKRCTRLHLVCILPSIDRMDNPNEPVNGTKQLKQMQITADLLQQTIRQLEREMDLYRNNNNYSLASQSPTISLDNKATQCLTYDTSAIYNGVRTILVVTVAPTPPPVHATTAV